MGRVARLDGAGTPFDWPEAIGFGRAPFASLDSGPWACVAGPNGLAIGCFSWTDPSTGITNNSRSDGSLLGFVLPLANPYNLWERVFIRQCFPFAQMVIRAGVACVIAAAGVFAPKFANGGYAGAQVFADPATGLPYSAGTFTDPGYIATPYTLAQSGSPGSRLRMSSFIKPFH